MTKLVVKPLGTCRVTNIFRLPYVKRRADLNLDGVYGYAQTASEILQLARYQHGAFMPPEHLFPFLTPSGKISAEGGPVIAAPDQHLVEISSLNNIMVDDVFIQANYWRAHFQNFIPNGQWQRSYWRLASRGGLDERREFLEATSGFKELPETDQAVLLSARASADTEDMLVRRIREISELLPGSVYFTHCQASDQNGNPLATRSTAIEAACNALTTASAPYVDVSSLSLEIGQKETFLEGDESLTHYSETFERSGSILRLNFLYPTEISN